MRLSSTPAIILFALAAGCGPEPSSAPSLDAARREALNEPAAHLPSVIPLPNGFAPESIAFGEGPTFYVGSTLTGAIYRGNALTGSGALLVPPQAGREALGIKYDRGRDRLFVAGGYSGQLFVYDAASGATLGTYALADPDAGPTDINDLVITRAAVYATDDARPVIYRVPLGPGGTLPTQDAVQTITLTGDFVFIPDGINANGIVATPDESALIVANTWTGTLYRVDPATGVASAISIAGGSVDFGDGLVLMGHTLYVVQGPYNRVAVLRLDADFTSATLERTISSSALAFPSTIATFGNSLYAVNARIDVVPEPDVEYQVVRLPRTGDPGAP